MAPMIPPQISPEALPNTSARQGLDPQTGKQLSPSAETPPAYSDEIQRKIDIARGKGLHREQPNTEAESGEQITLRGSNGVPIPCKYCQANPCHGMSWVFEGQVRFKCDACGKKQRLGVTGEVAMKTAEEFEGMDRAEANRNRAWREQDVQREEERQREMDEIAARPDGPYSALKDRAFIDSTFLS